MVSACNDKFSCHLVVLNIVSCNSMKVKDVFYQIRKLIGIDYRDYDDIPFILGENTHLFEHVNKGNKLLSRKLSLGSSIGILKSIIYYKSKSIE